MGSVCLGPASRTTWLPMQLCGAQAEAWLASPKAPSSLDAPQGELPLSAIHINLEEREKQIRSFLIEGGRRPGLGGRV